MYLTEVNIQHFVYMNEIFRQAIFKKKKKQDSGICTVPVIVLDQLSAKLRVRFMTRDVPGFFNSVV